MESCNLGRMLQAPPPPDAATASAPVHSASGNQKHPCGSKALAASGRPHKEKLLPGLIFALVFCPGLLCQTPPSHTPASSASLPQQVSHTDPKAIAEDGQRALAEGRYADAERDFKQLLESSISARPRFIPTSASSISGPAGWISLSTHFSKPKLLPRAYPVLASILALPTFASTSSNGPLPTLTRSLPPTRPTFRRVT